MNDLRCSKVYISKKKYPELYEFIYNLSVASKHITNHVRWHLRQIFAMPPEMREDLEMSWREDNVKRGNKELRGKTLYWTGLYYELLSIPEHFLGDDGEPFYNYAIKYNRNSLQQLIKREVATYFTQIKKMGKGENASLARFEFGETFQTIFSADSFTIKFYRTKRKSKSLNKKQMKSLSDSQKNQLWARLQLLPGSNDIEIPLEQGMFFVQAVQIDIIDENMALVSLIYKESEQNWKNQKLLEELQKLPENGKNFKKRNQLAKSLVKRGFRKKAKKSKETRNPNIYTAIDPGVTNLFTMATVDVITGDAKVAQIPRSEYETRVKNIDKMIDEKKSEQSLFLEQIFIKKQKEKHSTPGETLSPEEIHRLKVPGWRRQSIKLMTEEEKTKWNQIQKDLSELWSNRSKVMTLYVHQASTTIVNVLKANETGTLVLGKSLQGKTKMTGATWNKSSHFKIYNALSIKLELTVLKLSNKTKPIPLSCLP